MLSEFKDKQLLAYNLLVNDIQNNCITHAYLFDENNYSESFNMILAFVKAILCKDKYYDKIECTDCSLCKRINEGNYPGLKIISADGMFIKKHQIIDLQQDFSKTAVEGNKQIYIIRDCDKMRAEAANSMLKFLEEPQDNIIAILMTNNINNVLSTIISRCKIIKLNNDLCDFLEVDDSLKKVAVDFVSSLENKRIETILNIKDLWFSVINAKEREKMVVVFDIMIDIYYDIMKILVGSNKIKNNDILENIEQFSKLNSVETVLKKIDILIDAKDSVKYNVNSSLLIDSIIVSIGGIKNGSRY